MHQFYLIGDMLTLGAQMEMAELEKILDKYGLPYYSARLNKSINDKANVDNTNLAERIWAADMAEIERSDYIIINVNQNAVGSLVETGAVAEWNRLNPTKKKKVFCVCSDIRRACQDSEFGDRRSFSVNAFLYGGILEMTAGKGILSFAELDEELAKFHVTD